MLPDGDLDLPVRSRRRVRRLAVAVVDRPAAHPLDVRHRELRRRRRRYQRRGDLRHLHGRQLRHRHLADRRQHVVRHGTVPLVPLVRTRPPPAPETAAIAGTPGSPSRSSSALRWKTWERTSPSPTPEVPIRSPAPDSPPPFPSRSQARQALRRCAHRVPAPAGCPVAAPRPHSRGG